MSEETLKAPFPWYGGKSTVADLVWQRFGDVPNYVEPFAGSLAVLLGRPTSPHTETVNDIDCLLANFWRAVRADPNGVAEVADCPVNEAELSARHLWLITNKLRIAELVQAEVDAYDVRAAGYWVYGICSWIGSGWCSGEGPWVSDGTKLVNRQLPHLGDAGRGINRKLPHLGDAGRGINRKLPHLGNAGRGPVYEWFGALQNRLRRVRVACGDWRRVTGESVTVKHGLTGVFLDPPYSDAAGRADVYAHEDDKVAHAVREWAITNGDNPKLRIALCGYEGEHDMPDSWECVPWKARGGYGSQSKDGRGRQNSARERIWFSPACLKADMSTMTLDGGVK